MPPSTHYVLQARALTAIATAVTATLTSTLTNRHEDFVQKSAKDVNNQPMQLVHRRVLGRRSSDLPIFAHSDYQYNTPSSPPGGKSPNSRTVSPSYSKDVITTKPNYQLKEHATRLLTLAVAMDPVQTSDALRLARRTAFYDRFVKYASEKKDDNDIKFVRRTVRNAISRALANAIGVVVTAYAMLIFTVKSIPAIRLCVVLVGGLVVSIEISDVQDITMVELLLNTESKVGKKARRTIETYYPQSFLLKLLPQIQYEDDFLVTAEEGSFEEETVMMIDE